VELVLGHTTTSALHGSTEVGNYLLCGCDHGFRELEVLFVDDSEIELCVVFLWWDSSAHVQQRSTLGTIVTHRDMV
jgi:hypothetical protein